MRPFLVILLAGLMLIPMPTAHALHEGDDDLAPAMEPSFAFREAIYDLNRTIQDTEERHGEHATIDEAKHKRALAAQSFVAGNHWLTLHHLLEGTAIIERHNTWENNRGASDREASYYSDMQDKWDESRGWIANVHDRLETLEDEGVDLWMLDHVMLASAILIEGERLNQMWSAYQESWERGDRSDQMKNGLAAVSHGAIMHAEIASDMIDRAKQNATQNAVGSTVGSHTLRGIMESLEPLLANGSMSLDRDFNQLIGGHIADEHWLASLGGTVAWSQDQAPAAVQHVMQNDEPPFEPGDVLEHLYNLDEEDTSLDRLEELGVDGATTKHTLKQAQASVIVLQDRVDDPSEATWQHALQAGEGLGALSAAHTSLAILSVASGDAPPDRIIHLPTHSPGAMDLGGSDLDVQDEDGGAFAVPAWGWLVTLLAGLIVAFVVHRRRR